MTPNAPWFEVFVRDVLARWPGAERTTCFDLPALVVNGHPFCVLYEHDIAVRLDEPTRARALEKPAARPFEPEAQKAPKDWILLTVPSSAAERFSEEWARLAYDFVRGLPPKTVRKPEEPKRAPASRRASGRRKASAASRKSSRR